MRLFLLFCLMFISFSALATSTLAFQVPTSSWKKMAHTKNIEIYSRTHSKTQEMITLRVFPKTASNEKLEDVLKFRTGELQQARGRAFGYLGFSDYQILEVKPFTNKPGFEIHARLISFNKKTLQAVERQYFIDDKIYQVVFTETSNKRSDAKNYKNIFKYFKPNNSGRAPASDDDVVSAENLMANQSTEASAPADAQVRLQQGDCSTVPLADRTDARDKEFFNASAIVDSIGSCILGMGDTVLNTWESLWNVVSHIPGAAVATYQAGSQYVSDPAFRDQVNGGLGTVTGQVMTTNPLEYGTRISNGIAYLLDKTFGNFACYNSAAQARLICKAYPYVIASTGLLVKILGRANLSGEVGGFSSYMTRKESALAGRAAPVTNSSLAWVPGAQALQGAVKTEEAAKYLTAANAALRSSDPEQLRAAFRVLQQLKYETMPVRTGVKTTPEIDTMNNLSRFIRTTDNPQLRLEATDALANFAKANGRGPGVTIDAAKALDNAATAPHLPPAIKTILEEASLDLRSF